MVTFFGRFAAYFIDTIIVGLLLLIVGIGLPDNTSELRKKMSLLEQQYINNEITMEVYMNETFDLTYEIQNKSKLANFLGLAVTIAYFVIFQTLYNGQTLGKKIFKLRIVDVDTKESIGIWKMLLRSLFTLNIVSSSANICLILFFQKSVYIPCYTIIYLIELLFIIVVIMMILYRKDKRGMHDLLTNTCVIQEV